MNLNNDYRLFNQMLLLLAIIGMLLTAALHRDHAQYVDGRGRGAWFFMILGLALLVNYVVCAFIDVKRLSYVLLPTAAVLLVVDIMLLGWVSLYAKIAIATTAPFVIHVAIPHLFAGGRNLYESYVGWASQDVTSNPDGPKWWDGFELIILAILVLIVTIIEFLIAPFLSDDEEPQPTPAEGVDA